MLKGNVADPGCLSRIRIQITINSDTGTESAFLYLESRILHTGEVKKGCKIKPTGPN
jgi:hypothetical protein